ncbi:MAG: glyceraldehyde 3-phosphate dehydrogenase NAD-binding domain-containing protein [Campylobacterota bacterium]|nr:glyceraldehyde 3-phosphate dehydrogenase NAD-binding domain-containing protein [Campylobacterota bacterium]
MRILLNGVGRIGKAIIRYALDTNAFDIVAINELNPNLDNIAYSINFDSTYGRYHDPFSVVDNSIENKTSKIQILNHSSLNQCDFKTLEIDFIIDASGAFYDKDFLKNLAVKAVFLTHPCKTADINVILGVNEDQIDFNQHKIISTSSCNATAVLPVLKLIDDNFTIEYGDLTTVHPMLNHQKVLDGGCIDNKNRDVKCNFEFGRSATQNIIPSKTTTLEACSYVMPHINSDILTSSSLRVPTPTVGLINLCLIVKKECTQQHLLELFNDYEKNQTAKILLNNTHALVSSDFQAQTYTSIVDHRFTDIKMNKMLKLVIWYDNEWGYASKVVETVQLFKHQHEQ